METRTDSVLSPEHEWRPDPRVVRTVLSPRQSSEIRLNVEVAMYSWRPTSNGPVKKYVLVHLQNSHVNPTLSGSLEADSVDKRGWYTELVDVFVYWGSTDASTKLAADLGDGATLAVAPASGFPANSFKVQVGDETMLVTGVDDKGTTWTVDRAQDGTTKRVHASGTKVKLLDRFGIVQEQPSTTAMQAAKSTTSSIDFSLNAGFFGGDAATGGASMSRSISHSWSENISDFRIRNMTTGAQVHHSYRLAAVVGGKYEQATDLMDMSFWEPISEKDPPGRLFRLPELAKSSLPLLSQVLFVTGDVKEEVQLNIGIRHQLAMVEKSYTPQGGKNFGNIFHPDAKTKFAMATMALPIDFSLVR